MSEFLKFAYELLSQVLYNIVQWLAAFVKLLLTGWVEYFLIFRTYFPTLNIPAKILSVLAHARAHCDPGAHHRAPCTAPDHAA